MSGDANVDNAADPEQVKAAKKKERHKEIQNIEDVRAMLRTGFGRRFLWRYLSNCNVFNALQGPLPHIHYEEGYRQVGLQIMDDIIQANPEALVEMMSAANAKAKEKADAKKKEEKSS